MKKTLYFLLLLCALPLKSSTLQPFNEPSLEKPTMFEFPKLTGKYAVGTTSRHAVDLTRQEPCNPTEKRELMVELWFPTTGEPNKTLTPYRPDDTPSLKAKLLENGYPEGDLTQLDAIFTHTVPGATPLPPSKPYPLILFSHGYLTNHPRDYSAFFEELASHGYIVAAIAHTYFADMVTFPDGRRIPMDPEKTKGWSFDSMCSDQDIWVKDTQCALDSLVDINSNPDDAFYGLLDMNNVGMFGHSFGGTTSFLMCLHDDRIKAGIDLDGGLMCTEKATDLSKPFMFVWGDSSINTWKASNEELVKATGWTEKSIQEFRCAFERAYNTHSAQNIIQQTISNLCHGGFSDYLLLKELPIKQVAHFDTTVGTAEGFETMALINRHIVSFFNKNLKSHSLQASNKLEITLELVTELIAQQFPEWAYLPIRPVDVSGWDNRTFHLGEEMSIRLPSSQDYADQVQKEQTWLPILATNLSFPISQPLAMGQPTSSYPFNWSVYRWIKGTSANTITIDPKHLEPLALQLAQFLNELHKIDTTGGPIGGLHNWYRGCSPAVYDAQTRTRIIQLKDIVDPVLATAVWDKALSSTWNKAPVWIHGDFSVGNILVKDNKLTAVIDFGCMGIGDPACDLVIAWTFLTGESRKAFKEHLPLDASTWARARGWALWRALYILAPLHNKTCPEAIKQLQIIADIFGEHEA